MARTEISIPELALIAGTRAAFGAGVGLLLADRMKPEQRRAVGWTLVAVGVLTTVPLVTAVLLGKLAVSGNGRSLVKDGVGVSS